MRRVRCALWAAGLLTAVTAASGAAEPLADPPPDTPAAPTSSDGEAAPELLLWEEIPTVVSASRHEEPVSRAPNAVSLVTADQIHRSGLLTLGELLRLAPGVDVGRIDGWSYGIGVRGLYGRWSKHTLVMMDGRTVYNPFWGGVNWSALPLLLEDIERIEIVRGPGGAAWGANAANGVINIITKKPAETPGLFLSQTVTNRLDSLTHLRYGHDGEKFDFRLSAGYEHLPEIGVRHGEGNHDFVRMPRVHLRSTYHIDDTRYLDLDAGYVEGVTGSVAEEVPLAGAAFADARWFSRNHFVRLRYGADPAPDDAWHLQYFYNRDTWAESDGGPWARYTQHDVEAQRTQGLGARHLVTYGGNIRVDHMSDADPSPGVGIQGVRFSGERVHNHQAGLFAQDRITLGDQWTAFVGVRADRNSFTDWEWAGRGAVLFHPAPDHTFRAAVARAFRTPTLLERDIQIRVMPTGLPAPFPAVALRIAGRRDVNAAYIKAYEFGYTYQLPNLRLDADFFWNNYRGIMTSLFTAPAGAVPQTQAFFNNIDGDLYGVELGAQWQATEHLRLGGWTVWEQWVNQGSRSRLEEPLTDTDSVNPPQVKVFFEALYEPVEGLDLHGRMWWVDEVKTAFEARGLPHVTVPAYARFDFGVSKDLGDGAEVAAGVLNAFDSRHLELRTFGIEPVEVGERTWYVRFQKHW